MNRDMTKHLRRYKPYHLTKKGQEAIEEKRKRIMSAGKTSPEQKKINLENNLIEFGIFI